MALCLSYVSSTLTTVKSLTQILTNFSISCNDMMLAANRTYHIDIAQLNILNIHNKLLNTANKYQKSALADDMEY